MPAGAEVVVAVDTSLAIPLVVRTHDAHPSVKAWRAGRPLALSGHAWIETYAVLTRLPGGARVSPGDAVALLVSNFAAPLAPTEEMHARSVELLAAAGIGGGAAYDGWVALAALEHGARLASRDRRAEATYRRLGVEVEMVT